MSMESGTFDIAGLLRADLESLPPNARAACVARIERRAARRYRKWAGESTDPVLSAGLRVCAAREEGIADMIEAIFPAPKDSAAAMEQVLDRIGHKLENLFTKTGSASFATQAAAERTGARSWRELAALATDVEQRWTLEICARLETESAEFLESTVRRLQT